MTVIPSGYCQANYIWGGTSAPSGAECTLGFDVSGWAGTPDELAESIADQWTVDCRSNTVTTVTLVRVDVKFGPVATGPSGTFSINSAGLWSTAAAGPNTSYLLHKNTAFGGRAGKGRMYLPGVAESAVNVSGVIDSGVASSITADWSDTLLALGIQGAEAVVLHGDNSPITTPTPITSVAIDATSATQRRRLRR